MNLTSTAFVPVAMFCFSGVLAIAQDTPQAEETGIENHAFALRTAILENRDDALMLLSLVPGTSSLIDLNTSDDESTAKITDLWSPFFQNVMVEISDQEPDRPAVLYYNPLVDAGLYLLWKFDIEEGYQIEHIHAFPGERLGNDSFEVFDMPEWMLSEEPLQELVDIVSRRRQAFIEFDYLRRASASTSGSYRQSADEFMAIAHRLVHESIQRTEWADLRWLESTLEEVQTVLHARNTALLLATTPGTVLHVAEFLSELPTESISGLVLDKVVAGQDGARLLIGSNAEDGTTYIWVLCQLLGGVCELNQFAVVSFADVF